LVWKGGVCGREATTAAHLIEGLFYPAEPFVDIFQRQLHARRIVSQLHPTDKHENASQTSNRDPDPLRPDYVPRGGSANVPGVSHYLISSSNGCP
jgi:hypothetical protein